MLRTWKCLRGNSAVFHNTIASNNYFVFGCIALFFSFRHFTWFNWSVSQQLKLIWCRVMYCPTLFCVLKFSYGLMRICNHAQCGRLHSYSCYFKASKISQKVKLNVVHAHSSFLINVFKLPAVSSCLLLSSDHLVVNLNCSKCKYCIHSFTSLCLLQKL